MSVSVKMPKCYSVRLRSLYSISTKCYRAVAFDGSEALIPKGQVFGVDEEVSNSDSYWISEWILEQKKMQFSRKKWTLFNKDGKNVGRIEFKHHVPKKLDKREINHDESLRRAGRS